MEPGLPGLPFVTAATVSESTFSVIPSIYKSKVVVSVIFGPTHYNPFTLIVYPLVIFEAWLPSYFVTVKTGEAVAPPVLFQLFGVTLSV
jgi:hypothetical protein